MSNAYKPRLAAATVRCTRASKGVCRKLSYSRNYHLNPKLSLINQALQKTNTAGLVNLNFSKAKEMTELTH